MQREFRQDRIFKLTSESELTEDDLESDGEAPVEGIGYVGQSEIEPIGQRSTDSDH